MKNLLLVISLVLASSIAALAADSAAEKAFVEKFKTAFEANDTRTLESMLYTKGAHPEALEFYTMMLFDGAGSKISKIELMALSAEEQKKAEGTQEGPDGEMTKMPIKPTKKLVYTVDMSSESGTGSSTSSPLVGEHDGQLVIPVPVPAK